MTRRTVPLGVDPFSSSFEVGSVDLGKTFPLGELVLGAQRRLTRRQLVAENMTVSHWQDEGERLVLQLEAKLAAGPKQTQVMKQLRYPAEWWSALKVRFFPAWALARWPAKWTTVDVVLETLRVCPHIGSHRGIEHVLFLSGEGDEAFHEIVAAARAFLSATSTTVMGFECSPERLRQALARLDKVISWLP